MLYNKKKILLLKLGYYTFFLVPATFFLQNITFDAVGRYRVGQMFGVLGITALALQLVLTSRMRFLERGVGMDRLTALHKNNGKLLATFLVLHPTLMFWDSLINPSVWLSTLASYTLYHWLGVTALLLIFFTITITIYSATIKLNYEVWKVIHKVGYVIIVLGFLHSMYLGSDLAGQGRVYDWWLFVGGVALFAFFYRNLYRHIRYKNNMHRIEKIVTETKDVRSIYLKPQKGSVMSYAPGQFAFARIYSKAVPSEEHHFTISSIPTDSYLTFTIKESGDYTRKLGGLAVGDTARLEGPYGAFSNVGMKGPFVMIAGGIGITPIISMIRAMEESGKKDQVTLLYINKNYADIAFKKELDAMEKKNKWLNIVHILSQEDHPDCHFGRLNEDILKKEIKNLGDATYFVCGPVPMMDGGIALLKRVGVSKRQIYSERFALR